MSLPRRPFLKSRTITVAARRRRSSTVTFIALPPPPPPPPPPRLPFLPLCPRRFFVATEAAALPMPRFNATASCNQPHHITSHHITSHHITSREHMSMSCSQNERTVRAEGGWLPSGLTVQRPAASNGAGASGAVAAVVACLEAVRRRGGGFLSLCLTKICAMSSCGSRIAYLLQ